MKKLLFYFALLILIPASYLSGGVESPLRFLYYPVLVLLIPKLNSKALLQASLTFSIFYSLLPFAGGGGYPVYIVAYNVPCFILMAVVSGRISDTLHRERDSLVRTADTYQGLTNDLNLKILNLQSKVDSLSEACERIREVDKNKTHFISNVSHEIRAPLSSIRSFSEILNSYEDIDEDTRKEFLGIINSETERLTQLANDILDVVRIESGKIEWHMDSIDMGEIAKSAVKIMLPLAKSKDIAVEARIPEKKLPSVRGDNNRLLQVMLNLISNAIKFTAQGTITIGIEDMPAAIKVYVSDTGEGIYPEEKEKIFEEFYRIGDELSGRPSGSGLGLSISKRIIEVHGGNIEVESQLGKGTTFFFVLPKENAMVHIAERINRPAHVGVGRILVLEEFKPIRQLLRSALERFEYKTIGAESIKMALDIVKVTRPDAILIGYPENEEHFEELRTFSRVQGIPLFLGLIVNDEKLGPQVAVNGYISKPLEKYQMQSAIQSITQREPKRIMIISDDHEEARSLQFFAGVSGYETVTMPDVNSIDLTRTPDVVIIGTQRKNEVYRGIGILRANPLLMNTPLLLALNIMIRDMKCVGLGSSDYGKGLDLLFEALKGGVPDAAYS